MVDDGSAAGGPRGPGALESEAPVSSAEALVAASGPGVVARVSVGAETAELMEARLRTRSHKEWLTVTKLGCLVKDMKIKSLKIYLFSLSIKESEIIDFFLGASLKDEVLKIMRVQNHTRAG
ncbi:hypothetical protein E2I00_017226 [Balaenoptera physalus]|uniref:Uncharacterized protein n=1 Tax=Balaenoptera physalus TaxID=9770 RepID=A0A6A1QG66_BALPH|nr:hypothetical protein E2I00_017226 [Balaenoptera physalus]